MKLYQQYKHMKSLMVAFVIVLVSIPCASQQSATRDSLKNAFVAELHGHGGKLIKIHGEYPDYNFATLIEGTFAWKMRGAKSWHAFYGFPTCGFSIVHAQFGNQDILGQALAVIPTMRFEHWKKKFCWSWKAGLGIAGFNKPYHPIDNPLNLVIGSRFTNMSMLKLDFSAQLSSKLRYHGGFSFTHCSDAHLAVPNIGANLFAVSAGISFSAHDISRHGKIKALKQYSAWLPGVQLALGLHEFPGTVRPAGGPIYFVYGMAVDITKRIHAKGKLSFGLNHQYYTAYHDYALSQELFTAETNVVRKSQNIVVWAGYEWCFSRFSFFLQAGINVYDPVLFKLNDVWDLPKHGPLYLYTAHKIGYRQYLFDELSDTKRRVLPYFGLAVKTNGGTADFLEFAIGSHFRRKKQTESTLPSSAVY